MKPQRTAPDASSTTSQRKGHPSSRSSPLVPAQRPDAAVHQRRHGAVQGRVPRPRPAPLPARGQLAALRARRRQAQRPRERRLHARHHTFFEMLGNFSFGDYFKREAIAYAWEFITKELGHPARAPVGHGVSRTTTRPRASGAKEIGVDAGRITRLGAKDNFWAMGDTGPCGPCTEIFYDHGPTVPGGPPGTPDEDGDRYVEIWNLVFMQYDRVGGRHADAAAEALASTPAWASSASPRSCRACTATTTSTCSRDLIAAAARTPRDASDRARRRCA